MSKKLNLRERDGELDLSMSNLQEVPVRDIAAVKKATSLDLSNNRIRSLGNNFSQLSHLLKLDLSKNQLRSLPDNFGDLVLLRHLDLYSNQLNQLPLSFGRLKNLKFLDLKDNPLVPALAEIAGPCQDNWECQACAKKVVAVIAQAMLKLEEEQRRLYQLQKEKVMAGKTAAKKEQQNHSKEKKYVPKVRNLNISYDKENLKKLVKPSETLAIKPQKTPKNNKNKEIKEKVKENKNQEKKENKKVKEKQQKVQKRGGVSFNYGSGATKQQKGNKPGGSSSVFRRLLEIIFFILLFAMTFLWYLYIVDIEKYHSMRDLGVKTLNSTVHLLPAQVVTKGHEAIEYIRPTVEVAVGKIRVLVNQTSTVLNTNPTLRDHWSNVNEISTVIGEQIAEYMRTVYRQIPIYYDNAKNKLFLQA